MHDGAEQGIRGIELVPSVTNSSINNIWIANQDFLAVDIYSAVDGSRIASYPTPQFHPVGLYYDPVSIYIFVGGSPADGTGDGIIYIVDPMTTKTVRTLQATPMNHPTGMLAIGDILYVLEQENDHMLSFHIPTGAYLGQVVQSFETYGFATPEQLILSPC